MKFLIFVCLFGYSAASFLQKAAPAVDDSVNAFLKGIKKGGSLRKALGSDDPVFVKFKKDIRTELGKTLRDVFDDTTKYIQEQIDHGKEISQELSSKVEDLQEKLKEINANKETKEKLKKIKEKAKEILRTLLEKLSLGKRNLDHEMDAAARMKFIDFVETFREKILSDGTIQKVKEYIKHLASNNPVVQKLKGLVKTLRDADIREILSQLLEYRYGVNPRVQSDSWNKIKPFFKDQGNEIQEHSKKFSEWIENTWSNGIQKLKEKYRAIRAITMESIVQAKDDNAKVASEAIEFFRPYKKHLGSLWRKIVEATKEAIGKF